nr:ABC-2 family transporter protein [Clostridia bacterium]
MRYIVHAVKMLFKSAMQYRASLLMQVLAQFVMTGGEMLAVIVLLSRFKAVGQWGPWEIMFFFGVMQSAFALTELFGRGIAAFMGFVQRGDFDALLLRPRPLLVQVLVSQLDLRRFGSFVVGLIAILTAALRLQIQWTAMKALLLGEVVLGSMLLVLGLFMIEATVSFFSVKSIEMVNILTYGGRTACQYPVDVYPGVLRFLFTYLAPFAMCMHWPVSYVLAAPMVNLPVWGYFLTPLAGAVFFAVMVRIWYVGVRHYRSTGT